MCADLCDFYRKSGTHFEPCITMVILVTGICSNVYFLLVVFRYHSTRMASDDETVQYRKKKKPIISDDSDSDSDSDSVPCFTSRRRKRCTRVYLSDGEVASSVPLRKSGGVSSDEGLSTIHNWSEGDQRSSEESEGETDVESVDSKDSGQFETGTSYIFSVLIVL